jgi:hypothetical protein
MRLGSTTPPTYFLTGILNFRGALFEFEGYGNASPRGYNTGYAEQAHLSREVRDLTGLSARALVKQIAG